MGLIMPVMGDYQRRRVGKWHLTVLAGEWNRELQERILPLVERQASSKHPQTFELPPARNGKGGSLFLKTFCPPAGFNTLKNLWRKSKAARVLYQGVALSAAGFEAPVTIAAGETGRWTKTRRGFVLTAPVRGQSLISYVHDCSLRRTLSPTLTEKRRALADLGRLIRRFHDLGFVHGDLVPSNLFILDPAAGRLQVCFMDNDRTRKYPGWLPQSLWKRNLVQLNRFPLPGISLQDRLRFFLGYSGGRVRGQRERALLRWLEQRTRKRRRECDRIVTTGSFRMLMRWTPDITAGEQSSRR